MTIQNRVSVTLSPRMRKALELAAGLEGSTTASYASQLLTSSLKNEIKDDPILLEKWVELEKDAIKNESWEKANLPINIAPEDIDSSQNIKKGWFLSGDNPGSYIAAPDDAVVFKKRPSGHLYSKESSTSGFGTLMQQTKITKYLGKKLRYSAAVKTKGVKDWAGLWVRLDDADQRYTWFENMEDRPIKGTKGWRRYTITFEVSDDSAVLNFGILLVGSGHVWINDVEFAELDRAGKIIESNLPIPIGFKRLG